MKNYKIFLGQNAEVLWESFERNQFENCQGSAANFLLSIKFLIISKRLKNRRFKRRRQIYDKNLKRNKIFLFECPKTSQNGSEYKILDFQGNVTRFLWFSNICVGIFYM